MENPQINGKTSVSEETLETSGSDTFAPAPADEEVTDIVQNDETEDGQEPEAGADQEVQEAESDPEMEEETENFVQSDEKEDTEPEEGQEEVTEEVQVSSPAFTEDNPMPVYLVEQEEQENELALYSVSGSPYPGTVSSTYLDYFAGIADKLKYSEHYIAFRASQYEYYMAWGEGLTYDGSQFRGSALSYCRIYTGSGSSNMTVTFGSDTFYLTPGTGFVYSDLDHFASLTEGGTGIESLALLFAVGFAVVYGVCHDIFDYIMEHVYRK